MDANFYFILQVKRDLKWSENTSKVTFRSRTTYEYLPEENDLDPSKNIVVVPNLLVLGGLMKNEVRPQADFIKKSVIWPILTSTGLKEPFIKLTIEEFLWGYEDELACLDSNNYEYEDPFDDNFFNDDIFEENSGNSGNSENSEKSKAFGEPQNYRTEDGKCLFGALNQRNHSLESAVTMLTGKNI